MRKITTYADYKREKQARARVKKGVLWACVAVFGFVAVFGLGYLAGTRVSAQMAQIGECVADGGSGYMTTAQGVICLYD